jgi:hypothetical protein
MTIKQKINFHVIFVDKNLECVSKKEIKGQEKLQKVVDSKAKSVILYLCIMVKNGLILILPTLGLS